MPDGPNDSGRKTRRRLDDHAGDADSADTSEDVPNGVVEEAVRLTRLARRAVDEAEAEAYRADREERVAEHGFRTRIREEEARDVLVLYPAEWMVNGTVQFDAIEDTDRAIERTISGIGDANTYDRVNSHNRNIVARVRGDAGEVHAANANAFADFMGNHYVRHVGSATDAEVCEFLEEYYPRNAFPTDEQRAVVKTSLRLVFEVAGQEPPPTLE